MANVNQLLDQSFLEMRGRCLSLAADLDRLDRAAGGQFGGDDARLSRLRQAIGVLLDGRGGRAERVQMIFSDLSPAPQRGSR
jgi:hypothetical protein